MMFYLFAYLFGISSGLMIGGGILRRVRVAPPKFPYEYLDENGGSAV